MLNTTSPTHWSISALKVGWPLLVLLACVFVPSLAWAQDPFELSPNDLSRRTFIDPLFGPISGADNDSPLSAVMGVFNGAVLVVAGILMAYTIVAGTMSTAHDGEMLGKKWSSMWLPVRTSLGVAMLLPIFKGFCGAQAVVIWLAMQGAAIANTTWSAFISNGDSILAGATYSPPGNQVRMRSTFNEMLISSVCAQAHIAENKSTGDADIALFKTPAFNVFPTITDSKIKYEFGSSSNRDACGSVTMGEQPLSIETLREIDPGYVQGIVTPMAGGNANSNLVKMAKIAAPVQIARREQFKDAQAKIWLLAEKVVAGTADKDAVKTQINQLLEDYSKKTGDAAAAAWGDAVNQNVLDGLKADGWAMAGAFFMTLTTAQDRITQEITNSPVSVSSGRIDDGTLTGGANSMGNAILGVHSTGVRAEIGEVTEMVRVASLESGSGGGVNTAAGDSMASDMLGWFMGDDVLQWGDEFRDTNQNPLIMAQNLGQKMIAWGWAAVIAAGAGSAGAGILSLGTLNGVMALMAGVFTALVSAIMVPGVILSTYLPMMPYIIWIGAMLGWAIFLIEAVIAAPLWAVAHIAPDGDGAVGRGGQGYMLVLSLVLRPTLMVLGLIAALILLKPIGVLINSTFASVFVMSSGSMGFGYLTRLLAGMIIYMILMIMMCQRIFSLIHVIPDRVLRWIGGGSGNEIGEHAAAAGEGWTKAAAGIGGAMAIQGAASKGVDALVGHRRHAAQQEVGNRQADEQARLADDDQAGDLHGSLDEKVAKADASKDPGDRIAAANEGERAARADERSALSEGKVDEGGPGREFYEGAKDAKAQEKKGKTGAFAAYMQEATTNAKQKDAAYFTADNKRAAGTPLTKQDEAALSAGPPRPYEQKLIKAGQARETARQQRDLALKGPGNEDVGVKEAQKAGVDVPPAQSERDDIVSDAGAPPGDEIDGAPKP